MRVNKAAENADERRAKHGRTIRIRHDAISRTTCGAADKQLECVSLLLGSVRHRSSSDFVLSAAAGRFVLWSRGIGDWDGDGVDLYFGNGTRTLGTHLPVAAPSNPSGSAPIQLGPFVS